jgi:hypothetical protein
VVRESIVVVFDSLAYPLQVHRALTTFTPRTIVTAVDSIREVEPVAAASNLTKRKD